MKDDRSDHVVVSTIDDGPGRVHIALFRGHGADMVTLRWELSLADMKYMHRKLTDALWDRLGEAVST